MKEEIRISSAVHSRLIGSKGRNIRKIMDDYKVDIKIPRKTDPDPEMVTIIGNEDNVLDAKDYLLKLEEEYVSIKNLENSKETLNLIFMLFIFKIHLF